MIHLWSTNLKPKNAYTSSSSNKIQTTYGVYSYFPPIIALMVINVMNFTCGAEVERESDIHIQIKMYVLERGMQKKKKKKISPENRPRKLLID